MVLSVARVDVSATLAMNQAVGMVNSAHKMSVSLTLVTNVTAKRVSSVVSMRMVMVKRLLSVVNHAPSLPVVAESSVPMDPASPTLVLMWIASTARYV